MPTSDPHCHIRHSMASPSALLRKSSWKDKLSKRLGVGEKERERVRDRDRDRDNKLTVTNEDWLLIDDKEMETTFTNGPDVAAKKKSSMRGVLSSPLLGPRGSSVSKSRGEKLSRPSSPHPPGGGSSLQRRPSGRGNRLEVQNGRASPRSTSPNRSSVRKRSGNLQQRRAESPNEPLHQPPHPPQHHAPKEKELDAKGSETPPFAKVRDTLRIHRPKKRKGVTNAQFSSQMQYSAPEINLHNPSKYQDPFEAQPNFTDSTEERKLGQGHEFKPVAIPHNKPGYCDHCGETAWGLYRQVHKCTSKLTIRR